MYLVLATVLSVVSVSGTVLMSIDILSEGYGTFLSAPFVSTISFKVIVAAISLTVSVIWIFPMFYIISVSTLLSTAFEVFNKFLENHIEQNSMTMTHKFQRIRQVRLNLCKMVSHVDEDFRYYCAVLFVFSTGLACFILYVILKKARVILDLVMFFYYLLAVLSLIVAISVSAAFVNETVSTM